MTRTVVLTFDNLGAAAEVEQGALAADVPRGGHPSVVRALPRLLELLDELGLRATFFVEALNAEDYPDALRLIAAHGHEIGFHAWRHERWGELDREHERELVARSFAAYAQLGVDVHAFRPPGGGLNDGSARLLREHGVRWCSPEGERAGVDSAALAHLPFRWPLVDATYLHAPFGELRRGLGLPEAVLAPEQARERLLAEIDAERDPVAATLILHPFLMASDAVWAEHARLLRALAARDDVVVRPGGEVAWELLSSHSAPVL